MKAQRAEALKELFDKREQVTKLDKELKAYGACDPAKVQEQKLGVELAKEAAIRWTGRSCTSQASSTADEANWNTCADNFLVALSHLSRQTGCPSSELRQQLQVAEDYEDIC